MYESYEPNGKASAAAGMLSAYDIQGEALENFTYIALGKHFEPASDEEAAGWRQWRIIDALLAKYGSLDDLAEAVGYYASESIESDRPDAD